MRGHEPNGLRDPCEGLPEAKTLYAGEPEEQRLVPGGAPSWQRALQLTGLIGFLPAVLVRMYFGWDLRAWVPLGLALVALSPFLRRGPVCGVVAPRRWDSASPAPRRLASGAAALETRLAGVFQQPALALPSGCREGAPRGTRAAPGREGLPLAPLPTPESRS